MEHRSSIRSITSTTSAKRRRSTKVIRYSARALAQFILVSTGAFFAVSLYIYFKKNNNIYTNIIYKNSLLV